MAVDARDDKELVYDRNVIYLHYINVYDGEKAIRN